MVACYLISIISKFICFSTNFCDKTYRMQSKYLLLKKYSSETVYKQINFFIPNKQKTKTNEITNKKKEENENLFIFEK